MWTQEQLVFAIRLGGAVREIVGVKVGPKGDAYVFPPYSRAPDALARMQGRVAVPPVDVHMSKHRSGVRQLSVRVGGKRHPTPGAAIKLQPTSSFSGVELVSHMPLFKGQLSDLAPLRTNKGKVVLLDADSAGFRDDFIAVRVYLVEPNKDHEIPIPTNVGPYIRHIEKSVTPWVAVEAFQERIAG